MTALPFHLKHYLPISLWKVVTPLSAASRRNTRKDEDINLENCLADRSSIASNDSDTPARASHVKTSHMETLRQSPVDAMDINEGSTGPTLLDKERAEVFGARMLSYLNNGALTLLISMGDKLGLFEAMARLPAVTSLELAQSAELHERYVREWLAAMYVGGIVDLDEPRSKQPENRYFLPREHAAFLTWGRGPENVAVLTRYISILSSFEDRAVECFRTGDGIPAGEFGDLKTIMAADSAQTIASSLVRWILPLGQTKIVQDLQDGVDVLDVECGSGINLITLAKDFPKSWFTGYDTNPALIAAAKESAEGDKLQNIRFKCAQFTEQSESSAYDLVTCFGGIIETGDVKNVVHRVYQSLRRGGTFLLQDVAASSDVRDNRKHPAGCLLYSISLVYSLPTTICKTRKNSDPGGVMWGNDVALSFLRESGFKCDGVKRLADDNCNAFFFCTRE